MSADPGLTDLLAAFSREPDGPAAARVAELTQSIAVGQRAVTSQNLDLLAACERLERLGRPLNAFASVAPVSARTADGPLAGQPTAVKDIIGTLTATVAGAARPFGVLAGGPGRGRPGEVVAQRLTVGVLVAELARPMSAVTKFVTAR